VDGFALLSQGSGVAYSPGIFPKWNNRVIAMMLLLIFDVSYNFI
jgi:hypothetical protein